MNRKWIKVIAGLLCMLLISTLAGCKTANNDSAENTGNRSHAPAENFNADAKPEGTAITIVSSQQQYLPAKVYMDFANSDYIGGSVFTADVPAVSKTAKMVDSDSKGGQMKIKGAQEGAMPDTKIFGVSNTSALTEFTSGKRKITEGRMYKDVGECVISEALADKNNLSVGDSLVFENIMPSDNGEKITYELTITGIYSDSTKEYDMPYKIAYLNRRNEVITSIDTLLNAKNGANGEGLLVSAIYYLKSSGDVSAFEQELHSKGLPSGFSVRKV